MIADAFLLAQPNQRINGQPFFLWEIGQRLVIDHWMDHLFRSNATLSLWQEQPDPALRRHVEGIFPLCLRAEVHDQLATSVREICCHLTPDGQIKLQRGSEPIPCLPDQPITRSWFAMVQRWLGEFQRFGTQLPELETQISPGVIIGHHCKIAKHTVFHAPCWIGSGCTIEAAEIGPNTAIGENCSVAAGSEVRNSYLLSHTHLGPNLRLDGVIASPGQWFDHQSGNELAKP